MKERRAEKQTLVLGPKDYATECMKRDSIKELISMRWHEDKLGGVP